jgi:hypothetical protein
MVDRYYRRSKDVASRVVDGEAMLIKMPENTLFVLNPSGSRIWVHADGARSTAELCNGLDEVSVLRFLDEMTSHGLLERSCEPAKSSDIFPQDVTLSETTDEKPEIRECEPIEVLAGLCDSSYGILGNCRLQGTCGNGST